MKSATCTFHSLLCAAILGSGAAALSGCGIFWRKKSEPPVAAEPDPEPRASKPPESEEPEPETPEAPPVVHDGKIPTARAVPGRPGFVFSPYNNKLIDVEGFPSGRLVSDPQYPLSEKKYFRVP